MEELEEETSTGSQELLKPSEIYEELNRHLVGQHASKKTISVAVYNHFKRIATRVKDDVEIQKSNILLLGPTDVERLCLRRRWLRF